MKVTSKYFEYDTGFILLSEIVAVYLMDVGEYYKRYVIHTRDGGNIELALYVTAHFKSDTRSFKRYLGI